MVLCDGDLLGEERAVISIRAVFLSLGMLTLMSALSSCQKEKPQPIISVVKPVGDAQSCKKFVQDFYDWYTTPVNEIQRDHGKTRLSESYAFRVKPQLFASVLTKKHQEVVDLEASMKESLWIGFDPFENSMDPAAKYVVVSASIADGKCNALIEGIEGKTPTIKKMPARATEYVLTAELEPSNGSWAFANFHYGQDQYLFQENLLSSYQQLIEDAKLPKAKRPERQSRFVFGVMGMEGLGTSKK
jgi:hypothetical protein